MAFNRTHPTPSHLTLLMHKVRKSLCNRHLKLKSIKYPAGLLHLHIKEEVSWLYPIRQLWLVSQLLWKPSVYYDYMQWHRITVCILLVVFLLWYNLKYRYNFCTSLFINGDVHLLNYYGSFLDRRLQITTLQHIRTSWKWIVLELQENLSIPLS